VHMNSLGPIMFRKRSPISAVIVAGLFALGTLYGSSRYLSSHTSYDRGLGLVLLLVAMGLGVLTWLVLSTRWEFYRDGLLWHRMGKVTEVRFSDVIELSYLEVDGRLFAPDQWILNLTTVRGERVGVSIQPDLKREKDLPALYPRLLEEVTAHCRARLGEGVRWGPLKLRSDGIMLAGGKQVRFGPGLSLRTKQWLRDGLRMNRTEVVSGGKTVATVWAKDPNYAVGLRLWAELMEGKEGAEEDLTIDLEVSSSQAVHGEEVKTTLPAGVACECRFRGHPKPACPLCHGTGRSSGPRVITIRIPPGVNTGARLRLPGAGFVREAGGQPGNVIVRIQVKAHPRS